MTTVAPRAAVAHSRTDQALAARGGADDRRSTKRWWTIRAIADDLSVSVHTVYKWSSRGQPDFPRSIRLRNGELRVRNDWYEAWLGELEP